MGHEIVYCSRCLTRLISTDFESGRARRLGNQIACATCADELLSEMSAADREAALRLESSTKSRVVREASSRRLHPPPPTTRSVRSDSRLHLPEGRRRSPLIPILGGGGLLALAVVLVILVASGGNPHPPEGGGPPTAPRPVEAGTPDIPPPSPVPNPRPPGDRTRETEAMRLLEEVRKIPSDDLERKIAAYDAAIEKASLTPLYRTARQERAALVAKFELRFPAALADIDSKAKPLRAKEEFRNAGEIFRQARTRFDSQSWRGLIDGKIRDVRREADALYSIVKEKAGRARSRGEGDEVIAVRARVKKWGYADLISDLDASLAAIEAPKPPSAELKAYRSVWAEAMPPAAARDFDGALAKLREASREGKEEDLKKESEADVLLLTRLQELHGEIRMLLSRWPAGKALSLQYFDPERKVTEANGPVVESGVNRIEYSDATGPFFVEVDDVITSTLADVYRARRGKIPAASARVLALGCLLEGDEKAATELLEGTGKKVGEKYWTYAKEIRGRLPGLDGREYEARQLFHAAEVEFREPRSLAEAVVKYARLAGEFADTRLASRELERIRERKDAGREYVFFPDRIVAKGTFKRTEHEKVGPCWLSQQMAAEDSENYVEFDFSALPKTPYRCWVLAGGCCAETFRVHYQATELTARNPENRNRLEPAEPGGELAPELKHRVRYLKRTHASHGGPKQAARWEWMVVALPEYMRTGPKTVRLYSEQKGFGVAAVIVSALRKAPPRKDELAELREAARLRTEPVTRGLLAWWPLDERKGTTTGDALGGGHEGVFKGAPAWESGKLGGALKFSGEDYVEVRHDPALNAYPLSVSVWVKTQGNGGGLVNKYRSGSLQGYQVYQTGGLLRAWYFRDRTNYIWDGDDGMNGGKINDGKWHHVAFVVDDAGGRLYVDGELKERRAWTGKPGPTSTSQPVSLGVYPGTTSGGSHLTGQLDDVRLYDRSLTEDEVKLLATGDLVEARAAAEAAASDAAEGWEKLFDGKTLDCLSSGSRSAWKVEDGAIVHIVGIDNAGQSARSFGDGEFRVRFEVKGAGYFRFSVRQGPQRSAGVVWEGGGIQALEGKPHELIITCRGDTVEATLDGNAVQVTGNTSARRGRIQFNARGGSVRITAMDYRP